jgi:spermidine synthase
MSGSRPSIFRPHPELETSAFLLAAIGCLGIVTQLVLLRELIAAYGGNELSAGVTIAVWILCEAIGAWSAGQLRSSPPSSLLPVLSMFFSLAAVPAAVLIRPALGILPGEALSIPLLLAATIAVVFLPAALHGALFVTAAGHRPQGIGSAYVWEGVGTVLAGFMCFFLLNRLPSVAVVALSALPLITAQFVGQRLTPTTRTKWALGLVAMVSLAALILGLPVEKLAWGAAWKGQRVVAVENSHYGKIVRLTRQGLQLILYDGLPVLTVPPTQIERIEETSLLPLLIHPAPRRVLVLGSDLAVPAAIARFYPDVRVTTVQLDLLLARTSLTALSSDTSVLLLPFSIITADPVSFLRTTADTFDCIILTDDAPSSLVSSRLFSAEFYRLCRSHLATGGLLATAGPGNPVALSPDVAALLSTRLATLRAAFRNVLPVAADFPLILASDRPLSFAVESTVARLQHLSEPPRLLDSNYITSLLDPFRQQTLASLLAPRPFSPAPRPSSLTLPRELFLNMVRQNRLVSPAFGALHARLGSSFPFHRSSLIILGAMLLVVGLVGTFSRGHAFSRGLAILTSGFSGAAVSSLLIFTWQIRFGSVFSGIALLVTAFMLGSVLGAGFGSRSVPVQRASSMVRRFLISDLVLAGCAAAATLLTHGGPPTVFLATNCLAGACLGFQFAVAGSDGNVRHQSVVHRAGALTALDLAGGSLGGILTALVLVPGFGMGTAVLCAATAKLASALVQLTPKRLRRSLI